METNNIKISELKVGDFVSKKRRGISKKVVKVGYCWQSDLDYVEIYCDVTGATQSLVDMSEYNRVV